MANQTSSGTSFHPNLRVEDLQRLIQYFSSAQEYGEYLEDWNSDWSSVLPEVPETRREVEINLAYAEYYSQNDEGKDTFDGEDDMSVYSAHYTKGREQRAMRRRNNRKKKRHTCDIAELLQLKVKKAQIEERQARNKEAKRVRRKHPKISKAKAMAMAGTGHYCKKGKCEFIGKKYKRWKKAMERISSKGAHMEQVMVETPEAPARVQTTFSHQQYVNETVRVAANKQTNYPEKHHPKGKADYQISVVGTMTMTEVRPFSGGYIGIF